jgi:hypothetical protein
MSDKNEEHIAAAKRLAMQARTLTDDSASPYFEWCQEQIEADIYAALAAAHRAGKMEGLKMAREIAGQNAWKHYGDDDYSRGLDRGATSQTTAIINAICTFIST